MFKPGQPVTVRHHTKHTVEARYISDYRVLHQVNKQTNLLLTANGKEQKKNISDVNLALWLT